MGEFSVDEIDQGPWLIINGLWAIILASMMFFMALALTNARTWTFWSKGVRGFFSDFGAPVMVIVITALSFAIEASEDAPGQVPRRSDNSQIYDSGVSSTLIQVSEFGTLGATEVVAALIVGLILASAFLFRLSFRLRTSSRPGIAHVHLLFLSCWQFSPTLTQRCRSY